MHFESYHNETKKFETLKSLWIFAINRSYQISLNSLSLINSSVKVLAILIARTWKLFRLHVFFFKKLKSGAGRQFLKFSGHFATKSVLCVS